MKKRKFLNHLALAPVALALTACGGANVGINLGDNTSSNLINTSWKLSSWADTSLNPSSFSGFSISMNFDSTKISGISAVNGYSGSYTASADGTFSTRNLQTTLMASMNPDANQAETIYHGLLAKAVKFKLSDNKQSLTLFDALGSTALLVFQRV